MDKIKEGEAELIVPLSKKISRELVVFYNPVMKHNRDISVLLLNSLPDKDMIICDPLAGSGVRSLRFLKELKKNKISSLYINDHSIDAAELIEKNLSLNKTKFRKLNLLDLPHKRRSDKGIFLLNEEANIMFLESNGFDYIDIDPFGSPNPFLNNAIVRLSRRGILAVTATDTSALSGTFVKACRRKYWADPLRNHNMHETGLRILIRKVQLIGVQFEKALVPIFSYAKEHYMRVFFRCEKGKEKCDEILKQHGNFDEAGPLWLGKLWDAKIAEKMWKLQKAKGDKEASDKELSRFLEIIKEEAKIGSIGFVDAHKLFKGDIPKKEDLFSALRKKKYRASSTHLSGHGIRTDAPLDKVKEIMSKR